MGFNLELNCVTSPRALDRSRDTLGALSLEGNIGTWISLEPKFSRLQVGLDLELIFCNFISSGRDRVGGVT